MRRTNGTASNTPAPMEMAAIAAPGAITVAEFLKRSRDPVAKAREALDELKQELEKPHTQTLSANDRSFIHDRIQAMENALDLVDDAKWLGDASVAKIEEFRRDLIASRREADPAWRFASGLRGRVVDAACKAILMRRRIMAGMLGIGSVGALIATPIITKALLDAGYDPGLSFLACIAGAFASLGMLFGTDYTVSKKGEKHQRIKRLGQPGAEPLKRDEKKLFGNRADMQKIWGADRIARDFSNALNMLEGCFEMASPDLKQARAEIDARTLKASEILAQIDDADSRKSMTQIIATQNKSAKAALKAAPFFAPA